VPDADVGSAAQKRAAPARKERPAQVDSGQVHVWTFHAIGELIASAPGLPEPPRREVLVRGLQRSLGSVAEGHKALARQLGVTDMTVFAWRKGRTIPSLWCLLLVSSCLGISPLRLVLDDVVEDGQILGSRATPETRLDRPPRGRTKINPEAVRSALAAILGNEEVPPPSLREVAERIGQTYVNLRNHVPELSRLIAARFRSYQEAQGARTRARMRDEIRQAAIQLHRQGHYPSNNRVADLISNPSHLRSRAGQSARNEILRELGWRT